MVGRPMVKKKDAGPLAYTTRPIVGNYTNEEENR